MTMPNHYHSSVQEAPTNLPRLEVVIEIPRGSFMKRGSTGELDFISPLPCPFNYGSVENFIGLEGDLLDAVVMGPRLRRGERVIVYAVGAIGLTDRGMYDDKIICTMDPATTIRRFPLITFFRFYAKCKGILNLFRSRPGRNTCNGWGDAGEAISRARPLNNDQWKGPVIPF
jgi:inorganic pyrophosphatase